MLWHFAPPALPVSPGWIGEYVSLTLSQGNGSITGMSYQLHFTSYSPCLPAGPSLCVSVPLLLTQQHFLLVPAGQTTHKFCVHIFIPNFTGWCF